MRRPPLKYEYIVATVYVASMFMSIMDSTVVNVALPTLGHDFHATTSTVQWVITGYLLSLAVFIPASGFIGDRFGSRRVLTLAIVIFTGASVLCALATRLDELVIFRVLQGAGGGMMTPVAMATLLRAFPPERRVRASKVLMVPTVLAPATGPVIGGTLINALSWRWIFIINVPIGAVAIAFALAFLKDHREARRGRFDVVGALLSGPGLALFVFALSDGPVRGWGSPEVLATGIIGLVLCAIFIVYELRIPAPMLELKLLSDRMFARANLVAIFGTGAFMGALFLAPLYLQEARGYSALQSGLATFPEAVGVICFSQIAGRLYPIVGPRRLISAGLAFVGLVLFCFAFLSTETNLWVVRALMFALGVGMSNQILGLQAAAYATIDSRETGHASAIFNTQRQVSTALSVAVLGTVLSAIGGHGIRPHISAFHAVFVIAACFGVLGSIFALRINDSDAARTMQRANNRDNALASAVDADSVELEKISSH